MSEQNQTVTEQRTLEMLQTYRRNLNKYARECLKIRDKEGQVALFPGFNYAQKHVHQRLEQQLREKGFVRAIILKGRQQGISTYTAVRFYRKASLFRGVNVYILSHEQSASDSLFKIVDRFQTHNPLRPSTGVANVKELEFDRLDSSYTVATAGQKAGGRSKTTSLFHGCLSPETWIVEPDGSARRMGDFERGDYVRTHTGAVARVSFVSRRSAATLSVRVMGANEPIIATPEHRFVTAQGKVALRDLEAGDELCFPVAMLGSESIEFPYRPDYGRRPGRGGTGSVGPDTLSADYALGRVLGLYLAEGCLTKQVDGALSGVVFSVHEREVERTLKWLEPFRGCWRSAPSVQPREVSKAVSVVVYSRSFAEFARNLCGEKDAKHVPYEWHLQRKFAHGLAVGYFAGDGGGTFNKTTRCVAASSIRSAIAFTMRDALVSLGYGWAALVRREGALRNGRNEQTQWMVRLSGEGADRLWEEMGREPLARTRKARKPNFRIEGGFAHFPITEIEDAGEREVMDFEIDHEDHSYLTWQCASSNSEVAFWQSAGDHFASSVQTVPDAPGTEVILESTANGASGEFYERWQDAQNDVGDYIPIFVPWFWQEEYVREVRSDFELSAEPDETGVSEKEYRDLFDLTMEQMAWRRAKVAELRSSQLFNREYPASPSVAFESADMKKSFILPIKVLRARKRKDIVGAGPLIIGADPSGPGKDRFTVAARQGPKVLWVEYRQMPETAEAVLWLRGIIDDHKPDRMFVDLGHIGHAIVSLLKAIEARTPDGRRYADIVRGVNFGATSQSKLARPKVPGPKNRRAEMWDRSREWLDLEDGTALPDGNIGDMLQADATGPRIKPQLNNDFYLESKDSMKTRGVRSPDLWDAVALTFAEIERILGSESRGQSAGSARQGAAPKPLPDGGRQPIVLPGGANSWMGL